MDEHIKKMSVKMADHPGYVRVNRYVCKSEWAYELSFIFKDIDSFKAWNTSAIRDDVHATYLDVLKKIDVKEADVYGGARVYDEFK
jgi:antibiotic biosynthesis monooxygenase (ABM) superfamily enzyme